MGYKTLERIYQKRLCLGRQPFKAAWRRRILAGASGKNPRHPGFRKSVLPAGSGYYATSIDYNPRSDTSIEFFKKVQNKIHFAVHGKTATEVIYNRADAEKEFMGLKTFEGDRPHLKDAVVAKNYLDEKELRAMGQIVGGYLDFAERQAERHQIMTMKDWAEHLDRILTMSGEQLLQGNGSVSHDKAVEKATSEYKKYQQKTLSDVEKAFLDSIKQIGNVGKK